MTDHYSEALEALETAEVHRERLRFEYDAVRHKDPVAIARARDDLRHALTVAKLHTNLAAVQQARGQVQALEDLRGEIAALCQDLKAEPPAPGQRCAVCVSEHRPTCTHGRLVAVEVGGPA